MIPDGELLRSRVVSALSPALEDALDRELDGYALVSPRNALLDSGNDRGVITFESGVATLAYHTGTDRGGPPALADIGSPPYQFELYALAAEALELPHRTETLRIPPGAAAERLAGDAELAARVRAAVADDGDERSERDAVEAFLENEAAVSDIRDAARTDALERAEEWGFSEALEE
ncbi:hypothetical protein [Natronomonas sp. LN261]|uniref:hypothetical protein n=1 Tax=Natronomonas sp. LN261 TaxID=2750669 RepID=UPI0015EE753D|nr:hypothetical protein [Natronomonas sp. LN261]